MGIRPVLAAVARDVGVKVRGSLTMPGDKSISHRALILSAIAGGRSRIGNVLRSADIESTVTVLRALGVAVPPLAPSLTVDGVGRRGLRAPRGDLDCGNSGTTTRLMAGVVAASPLAARFVGDASLSRRPMRRIAAPLTAMGAHVELESGDGLPMRVIGGDLNEIEWRSEVASAQVKGAILLAATVAGVRASVIEPLRSRDHSERMLRARGISVAIRNGAVELVGGDDVVPLDVAVPGDPSSAAFFIALAALADEGALEIRDVCVNPTRTGFLRTVERMGAKVALADERVEGGEPVATVHAAPGELLGVGVEPHAVPGMLDELPLLACLAAHASGETIVRGAGELRVKESDRIATTVANLRALGVDVEERPDGMRIAGSARRLRGAVQTQGDHRLAMAFGVLGTARDNEIHVDDRDCVAISYPGFWSDLHSVVRS